MSYINIDTGAYPVTEQQIREGNPHTSFGFPFVPPSNYKYVFPVPPPAYNAITQSAVEGSPTLTTKGHFEQDWNIVTLPVEAANSNLSAVQQHKWEAIKAYRDRLKESGVKVGTNWFHSDTFSRTQQIGLVMMGASVPAIQWKTMDNTFVTMSQTLANQIFQATAAADANLFAIAESKRTAMMAMSDPTLYDISTGWPETHV